MTPSDAYRKKREIFIKDVVKKKCSDSDVTATPSLRDELVKTRACDKDNATFYHSTEGENVAEKGVPDPYLILNLNGTYRITTITVVNVYTGQHCNNTPENCTNRLDGAKVGVLSGKKKRTNNIYFNLLKIFRFQRKKRCHTKTKLTLKFEDSDEETFKPCGVVNVTSSSLTAEAQTYPIKCEGEGLTGNQVRVRLVGNKKILEIAEIKVEGYTRIGKY